MNRCFWLLMNTLLVYILGLTHGALMSQRLYVLHMLLCLLCMTADADLFPSFLLSNSAPVFKPPLLSLYNRFFEKTFFYFNRAFTAFIFRSGNGAYVRNYSPTSLLCCSTKIFVPVLYKLYRSGKYVISPYLNCCVAINLRRH